MGEEHDVSPAQSREQQGGTELKQAHQPVPDVVQERPATVLLSYASEDAASVRELQLRLKARGVRSWRDVDDLLAGGLFESQIVQAIEHEADAMALLITPNSLKSNFIWKVEIPAALRRHSRDPHFHLVPILQGVTFEQVRQMCNNRNLDFDLTRFEAISLTEGVSSSIWEEQNKRWNDAARRILRAALVLRLRRMNADRRYEPCLCLKTFFFEPPTASLDLDLDWLPLIHEKERVSTLQEWEHILFPALLDVKQLLSEKIASRRIRVFVQSILPIALALGFILRESTGFTLQLEGQKETWCTDVPSSEEEPLHRNWNYYEQGEARIAVVEVATSRSIKPAVDDALHVAGLTPAYRVGLELPVLARDSVKDATHAQAIARQVGRVCQGLYDRQRVAQIHLFVAVPAELAVLIGHQLNALCPITLYEFSKEGSYVEFGTIR
jgi:hypothetical protein